jgi:hypothetical protein
MSSTKVCISWSKPMPGIAKLPPSVPEHAAAASMRRR